jgi:hypothetical protein
MDTLDLAKKLFNYLYLNELDDETPIENPEYIIGFGHFDMDIPHQCLHLYQQCPEAKIIFSGGIGAGTADLEKPEADAFLAYSKTRMAIDEDDFIIENKSTNTAENLQFTLELLAERMVNFDENQSVNVALVANPYRQRRVWLTFRKHWPAAVPLNAPPETSFEHELKKFERKGFDLVDLMLGEIERIINYGEKGWIIKAEVPADILEIYRQLKS